MAQLVSGCAVPPSPPGVVQAGPFRSSFTPGTPYHQLAAALSGLAPDAGVLNVPVDVGSLPVPVTRLSLDDRVLFDTGSDQPGGNADAVLNSIAASIRQHVPAAQVTIVGHTDAIGSDAYNMDLSRRRGLTVARLLAERGVPRDRVSVVAIGKRQPVASNATPEGRARNRRVEFLISPDLAANLRAVQTAPADPAYALASPAPVLRLDPWEAAAPTAQVAGRPLRGGAGARELPAGAAPAGLHRSANPAAPRPAPHYDVRSLAPEVQPNALGSEKQY